MECTMTFNIGSQSGGVFNNVAGDQHITGGQQAMSVHGSADQAIEQLRAVLAGLRLDPGTEAAVRGEVEEIDAAVRVSPAPRARWLAGAAGRARSRDASRAILSRLSTSVRCCPRRSTRTVRGKPKSTPTMRGHRKRDPNYDGPGPVPGLRRIHFRANSETP
jgi:hypothetical protein